MQDTIGDWVLFDVFFLDARDADWDSDSVLIMPQIFPVTALTMNYTGPIIGFVSLASLLWYKLYWVRPRSQQTRSTMLKRLLQHRYYIGPNRTAHLSASNTISSEGNYDEKKDRPTHADVLEASE